MGAKQPASRLAWCPLSGSSRDRFGSRHGQTGFEMLTVSDVLFEFFEGERESLEFSDEGFSWAVLNNANHAGPVDDRPASSFDSKRSPRPASWL
jgi:hypothetical protein